MCLTETWTTNNNYDHTYIAATPNTRTLHGGGLAAIIHSIIILKKKSTNTINSIELLQLHLKFQSNFINSKTM